MEKARKKVNLFTPKILKKLARREKEIAAGKCDEVADIRSLSRAGKSKESSSKRPAN